MVLIEWPERAAGALPEDRIDIALSHRPALGSAARSAEITGYGKAAAQVERLKTLRQFLDGAGYLEARRRRMAGDASTRSYARLIRDDGVVILMNSPRRPDGGKTYATAVHLAEDVKPFVAIANGLRERGFSAPAIHHADLDAGFLITEDFGSEGVIEGDPPAPIAERYEAATDMLVALHREPLPERLPLAPGLTYAIPCLRHRCAAGRDRTDARMVSAGSRRRTERRSARRIRHDVARSARASPRQPTRTWVLRDFHSPNLIWLGERQGIARVGIIDFQDAVLGPASYDLVSLLQDARIDVPEPLELALLTRYIKARRAADDSFDRGPSSPSSTPSCRRSGTRGCSAPLPGSTAATASRNICVTSPGSGPISPVRWRTRCWRRFGSGMPPTCRRRPRRFTGY